MDIFFEICNIDFYIIMVFVRNFLVIQTNQYYVQWEFGTQELYANITLILLLEYYSSKYT